MSQLILNGRTNNTKPDDVLVVNKANRLVVPYINGLAPYDVNINGLNRPPILNGCVFYAPLWHPALSVAPGGTFQSLEASPKTCTVTGALWTPQGRSFDGTDDRIDCGADAPFNLDTPTIEVWVKLLADASGIVETKATQGNIDKFGQALYYNATNQKFQFYVGSPTSTAAANSAAVVINTWYHLVGVAVTTPTVHIYLDGVKGDDATGPLAPDATTDTNLFIGAYSNVSSPIKATIGEVWIYNYARSSGEIMRDYQRTKWRYQ